MNPPNREPQAPFSITTLARITLLCWIIALSAIVIANPTGDFAFNDDWSVAESARQLAKTGRLTYNGWMEPTLGIQVYWVALVAKVFGFSYQIARFSSIPFGLGCIAILLAFGRKLYLSAPEAVLAVLTIMCSPLVLPYYVSCMTEMPSLFFLASAIFAGFCALQAESKRACLRCMALLVLASLAGGSIRQIAYFPAVLILPVLALYGRKSREIVWAAAAGLLVTIVFAIAFQVWFTHQPGSVNLPLLELLHATTVRRRFMLMIVWVTPASLAVLALPALARSMRSWKRVTWPIIACASGVLFVFLAVGRKLQNTWAFFPWGNTIDRLGLLGSSSFVGWPSESLRQRYVYIFLILTTFAIASFAASFRQSRDPSEPKSDVRGVALHLALCTIPFSFFYLALTYVHASIMNFFDRYFILLLPWIVLGVLVSQRRMIGKGSVPIVAWLLAAIMTGFGIANMHDYYLRRRLISTVAADLEKRGVAARQIGAGFEAEAMTQLSATGKVRNISFELETGRMKVPRRYFWFDAYATALKPEYYIAIADVPGLQPCAIAPRPYRLWLPPFRGEVKVLAPSTRETNGNRPQPLSCLASAQ